MASWHKTKGFEKGYPRQSTVDKDGEYHYILTECGNFWYSVVGNPMYRNHCVCPKCGKTVEVVMPNVEEETKNDI